MYIYTKCSWVVTGGPVDVVPVGGLLVRTLGLAPVVLWPQTVGGGVGAGHQAVGTVGVLHLGALPGGAQAGGSRNGP